MASKVFLHVTPCQLEHCSQSAGVGMIDCACRVNWTRVGKTFSEKGSGIPKSEFVIMEADKETFALRSSL